MSEKTSINERALKVVAKVACTQVHQLSSLLILKNIRGALPVRRCKWEEHNAKVPADIDRPGAGGAGRQCRRLLLPVDAKSGRCAQNRKLSKLYCCQK